MPRTTRRIALAALLVLLASPARAGVPSAANSSVPACLTLCPLGDLPITVVARDVANNPVAGATVALDFSACPGAYLCTYFPPTAYVLDPVARRISATTDATGSVTIPAGVGGTGPTGSVQLFADGILLRSYALASTDQDGDGYVVNIISHDWEILESKLGTLDPTGDLDCSGGPVDFEDQNVMNIHFSVGCFGFVDPVRRASWGRVKQHYR